MCVCVCVPTKLVCSPISIHPFIQTIVSFPLFLFFSFSLFLFSSFPLFLLCCHSPSSCIPQKKTKTKTKQQSMPPCHPHHNVALYTVLLLLLLWRLSLSLSFILSFLHFSISLFLHFSISLFLYFSISLFLHFALCFSSLLFSSPHLMMVMICIHGCSLWWSGGVVGGCLPFIHSVCLSVCPSVCLCVWESVWCYCCWLLLWRR